MEDKGCDRKVKGHAHRPGPVPRCQGCEYRAKALGRFLAHGNTSRDSTVMAAMKFGSEHAMGSRRQGFLRLRRRAPGAGPPASCALVRVSLPCFDKVI
jgi:hypothetical protein